MSKTSEFPKDVLEISGKSNFILIHMFQKVKPCCKKLSLVQLKSFGIPKIKLDFQNFHWEFRSLGHNKLENSPGPWKQTISNFEFQYFVLIILLLTKNKRIWILLHKFKFSNRKNLVDYLEKSPVCFTAALLCTTT